MALRIDDLPAVRASYLRANGYVDGTSTHALLRFGEVVVSVRLYQRRFPHHGGWTLFHCPHCQGHAQVLRMLDGEVLCRKCLRARRMYYRVEPMSVVQRAEYLKPRRIARLTSDKPARVCPRPAGRMLDKRANLEAALRRSLLVARRARYDGFA